MADIKISQLGAAIAVGDTDLVPIVSGGNTLKATAAQVKEHSIGNANISSIGDGSVTGAISSINTDKQPKTLATSITVDGTEQTTVEGALGAINTDLVSTKQALTTQVLYFTSVACSATTGNFATKSDASITADHVVVECTFSKPSAITSDVTWTTANGSVTLNGTCTDATCTANITLAKKGN